MPLFTAFSTLHSQHTGTDNTRDLRCLYMFIYLYGKQLTKKNNKEKREKKYRNDFNRDIFLLSIHVKESKHHIPQGHNHWLDLHFCLEVQIYYV
jgi:hypothetical protein